MKRIKSLIILAGLMTLIVVAKGSDVTPFTDFQSGTQISANTMNNKLNALVNGVNSKLDKANVPLLAAVASCFPNACATTTAGVAGVVVNINSVTMTVPAAGFVRVSFNGTAECVTDPTNVNAKLDAQIVTGNASTAPVYNDDGGIEIWSLPQPSNPLQMYPLFMSRVIVVSPPTPPTQMTFYVNMMNSGSQAAACDVVSGNMEAMWFPALSN